MDGLRPERDELDRFQSRATPAKSKKQKTKNTPVEKDNVSSVKGSAPLFVGSFALTLVLFGFLGWAYMKQNKALTVVEKDLAEAMEFVNQSKLSMARLEGELNQAGAEIEQSGSAAAEQLKFLDSEMRKLWGVAGDKNRKAISQNADAIAGLGVRVSQLRDKQLKSLEAQLAEQGKQLIALQSKVGSSEELAKQVAALKKQFATSQSELLLTREALENDIAGLEKSIARMGDSISGLSSSSMIQQVAENSKAIASIDASRRQLNERIVALDRRLNELKLQVSANGAP
jgi:uncharacterized coiled-coil protein SlyX